LFILGLYFHVSLMYGCVLSAEFLNIKLKLKLKLKLVCILQRLYFAPSTRHYHFYNVHDCLVILRSPSVLKRQLKLQAKRAFRFIRKHRR